MTISKIANVAFAIGLFSLAVSCNKEDMTTDPTVTDNLEAYTKVGESTTTQADIQLYFGEDPFVGFNHVAVELFNPGTTELIENATITFLPMMDMGTMKHSAPNMAPSYDLDLEAYLGNTTFIMPSGMAGSWTFSVIIDYNNVVDTAVFNIEVVEKAEAKLFSFISAVDSTTKLFVALKEPTSPKVGLNNFELAIYKKASMMSFPPVTDLNIEVEPEMPTMGHGSPNNVNPIHVADGIYQGQVNFTMTGYWKVNLNITDAQGDTLKSDGYFDITFQ